MQPTTAIREQGKAPAPPPDAAAAYRSGVRLRQTLAVGVAMLVVVLVALHSLAGSPLIAVPFAVLIAVVIRGAARDFQRAVFEEVHGLDAARQSAVAEAVSKAQFLANMSHEIRTPMNGILGMAELLVQTQLDADQEQMAATIKASADALLSVLNDILDFSKIEAGKLELEQVDFDLWQLVDDCAGLMHATANQKGVELMTFIDPRLARCHRGDSGRLRQLALNFLSNAVKFTIEGEVVLGVDLLEQAETTETVRIWVRDTGIGISQDAIPRLFMPFTQADTSTTRRFGGTGLGLVICRRLVELMGGNIEVASKPGKGSTFAFTLRLPKGDPAHARKRPEEVDLREHSVLIVDDNETNRKLMALQLAPTRIGIDVAGNAISAIEALRQAAQQDRPFTMAIIDMAMPGIDGMQLARAIHNDPEVPRLPVSVSSSLGMRPSLSELAEAEVFRWLSKPLSAGRLLQVVHEMASLSSSRTPQRRPPDELSSWTAADLMVDLPVLVAEDNEINRRVIAGMLRRIGCQVTFAVDGREALELVRQREYGLVLMDCQMPELDGFEATRRIRAMGGPYGKLPIVALTANVLPADRDACLAAGMNDFLGKPVKLDVLRSTVQRWSRSKAGAPLAVAAQDAHSS